MSGDAYPTITLRSSNADLQRVFRLHLEAAGYETGCSDSEILSTARNKDVVTARRMIARGMKRDGVSITCIGIVLGLHHTTVMNYLSSDGWSEMDEFWQSNKRECDTSLSKSDMRRGERRAMSILRFDEDDEVMISISIIDQVGETAERTSCLEEDLEDTLSWITSTLKARPGFTANLVQPGFCVEARLGPGGLELKSLSDPAPEWI